MEGEAGVSPDGRDSEDGPPDDAEDGAGEATSFWNVATLASILSFSGQSGGSGTEPLDNQRQCTRLPISSPSASPPREPPAPACASSRLNLIPSLDLGIGKELHYYKEQKMQLQVNAAGALLHDWAAEKVGIQRLIDEGRVVLL